MYDDDDDDIHKRLKLKKKPKFIKKLFKSIVIQGENWTMIDRITNNEPLCFISVCATIDPLN